MWQLRVRPEPPALPKDDVLVRAVFAREGRVLGAYWHAASLQEDVLPRPVRLELSAPAGRLAQPVLVDPLANRIYRIARASQSDGRWTFENLPLADYPLIVADQRAV
jgi:hypothetical protein